FCQELIATLRWAGGVPVCPRCSHNQAYYCTTRQTWKCKACEKHFSVKLGTIFEDSHVTLEQWLPALWLMAQGRRGVRFRKLAELLGPPPRPVGFMSHRAGLTTRTGTFRKQAAPAGNSARGEYAA